MAKRCFEGKVINSLSLLINCHCWIDSRKPWGPGAVQWLSWLEFQRPSVLQSTCPWQEYKLLSSPRKPEEEERGEKSCQLKISFNLTNDFHLHRRHPSPLSPPCRTTNISSLVSCLIFLCSSNPPHSGQWGHSQATSLYRYFSGQTLCRGCILNS